MAFINLTQYLDRTAQTDATSFAVHDGGVSLSFGDLRRICLGIGWQMAKVLGEAKNQIIAVYLPKSTGAVQANIASLYSGNAYMNLSIKDPSMRTRAILDKIRPALVVTNRRLEKQIAAISQDFPVLVLEDVLDAPGLSPADESHVLALRDRIIDTDPSCVINTSGSTGTPKGVVLNHSSFVDFIERVTAARLVKKHEVMAGLSPLVFDIYSFELCMVMANACTLVLVPETFSAFPVRILELMNRHAVSFIFWVPTIMVSIANMELLDSVPLPSLKTVWFAGEVFPTAKCNYWRSRLPGALFVNMYGPIEITLDCLYYVMNRPLLDSEPIPIGSRFANTDIMLLTEEDTLAASGQDGEICVRGTSLALGYYNDPEKTAAAFVQNPLNTAYPERIYRTGDIAAVNPHGEFIFRGRKDTLVKHSGYRIDLAEIEHVVVNNLRLALNCCALYHQQEKQIYLLYELPEPLDGNVFRKQLGTVVPRYMVPGVYVHVPKFPCNTNGKIDRLLLAQQYCSPKSE